MELRGTKVLVSRLVVERRCIWSVLLADCRLFDVICGKEALGKEALLARNTPGWTFVRWIVFRSDSRFGSSTSGFSRTTCDDVKKKSDA